MIKGNIKRIGRKLVAIITVAAVAIAIGNSYIPYIEKNTTDVVQAGTVSNIDILDYDSNKSATNFVVNDVAGMEKIMELVNKSEDLKGKTITLMKDLAYDKKIENNHLLIKSGESFCGTFDGNNHTISGLNIKNATQDYVGLFSRTSGTIKNLTLSDSVINVGYYNVDKEDGTAYGVTAGGIAGYSTGEIKNCNVTSSVQIKGAIAGGIAGSGNNVDHCRNEGTVQGDTCGILSNLGLSLEIKNIDYRIGLAGGIIGYGHYDSVINYCCNYGTVTGYQAGGILGFGSGKVVSNSCNLGNVQGKGTIFSDDGGPRSCVGGIVGGAMIDDGSCICKDCYNLGNISAGGIYNDMLEKGEGKYVTSRKYSSMVGGILGELTTCFNGISNIDTNVVINSYNAGNVYGENGGAITALFDCRFSDSKVLLFKKCYYLEGTNAVAVNTKLMSFDGEVCTLNLSSVSKSSLASMLSPEFATELNGNAKAFGATGNVWTTDEKGINRGFPILVGVPYDENIKPGSDTDLDTSGETGECTHIFSDYSYSSSLSGNIVKVYVNGAKVKEGGVPINYKTCTLFTDICPSYIHTLAKDGKVKSASGKVIAGITMTNSKPMLEKGKIVDKEAANIAKATIRNGQITITAGKKSGVVYLWVMDTGSAGVCDSYPINVKGAPSNIELYNVDTTSNFSYSSATKYRKDNMKVGDKVKVYLYPYMKVGKEVVKATSGSYSATVDSKSTDYVSVKQDSENPYCYIISADSLKNGKKVSGKVTFICNQSGKKVTFTATVVPN